MNTQKLLNEYETRREKFGNLINTAKPLLNIAIQRKRIKVHSYPSRIKSFDSFTDKIRRKNLKDPFKEVHDIVGLRVICLFLSDIRKICDVIEDTFKIIEKKDEIHEGKKNIFDYMHCKYIVNLREKYKGLERLPFEIQVRTIAQDAWASVSHHLIYKQKKTIPEDLERDFYALNGLFYVADTHFSMISKEFKPKDARKIVADKISPVINENLLKQGISNVGLRYNLVERKIIVLTDEDVSLENQAYLKGVAETRGYELDFRLREP